MNFRNYNNIQFILKILAFKVINRLKQLFFEVKFVFQ